MAISRELTEQWAELDEQYRQQIELLAQDAWDSEIEPDEREKYITAAVDRWDEGAADRLAEFRKRHGDPEPQPIRVRSAKIEGIRAWGAAWLAGATK